MSQPFNNTEDDDFNLFVSPRRFSGRTPNAATAKSRVFQDAAAMAKMQAALEVAEEEADEARAQGQTHARNKSRATIADPTRSRQVFGFDLDGGESRAPGIEEQSTARRRVETVNWIAIAFGVFVVICGAWVCAEQFESTISPVIYSGASILGSPIRLGLCLIVGGLAMISYGLAMVSGGLAGALASDTLQKEHRLSMLLYSGLMFVSFVACLLVLFASGSALVAFQGAQVVPSATWFRIPPHIRCRYERLEGCVGHVHGQCNSKQGNIQMCAGLRCKKLCSIHLNAAECHKCARLLRNQESLKQCVAHELKSNVDAGCGAPLLRRVRIVLVTSTLTSIMGIVTTCSIAVVDLLVTS